MNQNLKALGDMLAYAEGTSTHKLTKCGGYDVVVTGIDRKPEIFADFSDHPFAGGRQAKKINNKGLLSSASGRYQQLYRYWPHYKQQLNLPDFSPESQEKLLVQLLKERGAYQDVLAGRISVAVYKIKSIWASLPGSGHGQPEKSLSELLKVYQASGGTLA
ncbi:glycoside hydrolase family 104 protein [Yersinia ruckeri]|uniref:glycoside hydrolase family 24 protein n=1 Tax=Yersinia ruckeri TaxID=29486 RepID=UPI0020C13CD3|nr:glycoside hydrolase family 104 protein [Yersinia ruckeri]EKN4689544.1 glycoside hydrolase family 104 protein [Yersinia ruckeri]MCK8586569.1 glycoside hydrolase family 104 protein [Yersinia ruckeri]MCW6615838.1 glycoside hydrolase family 104 protein [Yersinia ruckeri]